MPVPVVLVDPDPSWPATYERAAGQITDALGTTALAIHHAGSTAVADLPAKPVIDIVLVVPDPATETSYVPRLRQVGYELHIREPGWYEHRLLRPRDGHDINLHVFGPECPEVDRMLRFRDHLRTDADDRQLYAATKATLAARDWPSVQHYADAKSDVIAAILERADPSESAAG